VGSGAERRGLRLVDGEDLGQTGDPEDLEQAVLRTDQLHRAVVRPDLLQATDKYAEAGRVQEVDALHVDHQVVVALADQLGDLVAQLGCRVDVDFTANGND